MDFLYVIKSIIVNDCFVICVGLSLLSKTVDVTYIFSGKNVHLYFLFFNFFFLLLLFSFLGLLCIF